MLTTLLFQAAQMGVVITLGIAEPGATYNCDAVYEKPYTYVICPTGQKTFNVFIAKDE